MSVVEIVAWVAVGCAALPAVTLLRNLARFRPPHTPSQPPAPVSVLIPARDEERVIESAVRSVLTSEGVEVEVVVGDDGSTDGTAAIVRRLAREDGRVRLIGIPPLPAGWCGKQHACSRLARHARYDVLLFLDADVELSRDAVARAAGFLERSGSALVSGFPRQVTVTFLERLLLPLIHFVLLGFLPMGRMRRSTHPSYGAGCGQLMVVRRDAYEAAGGHGAIRDSLHDGVQLPRALRRAGFATDLFDATPVADCRMYRSAGEVWRGLGKNATEGLGAPGTIVPASVLLLFGQVLPPLLLVAAAAGAAPGALTPALVATTAVYLPRAVAASRFRQSADSVLLHPLAVLLLLVIQWQALGRRLLGRPASWKGRPYGGVAPGEGARWSSGAEGEA